MLNEPKADGPNRAVFSIDTDRVLLWAAAITIVGAFPIVLTWHVVNGDLSILAGAGRVVGTPVLLHPEPVWNAFVYVPGAAWFCIPLAHLPHGVAFFANACFMIACTAATAFVASRLYEVPLRLAAAMAFAWAPEMNAIALGQNAPLGALLAVATIFGLSRGSLVGTGIPLGLLLYKPTFAIPLIGVLVLFGRWRVLAVVAVCAFCWYLASIAATGGDVLWPVQWFAMTAAYSGADFAHNVDKAVSLPGILHRIDTPLVLVALLAAVIIAFSIVPLRRAPVREAASAACAIGLAVSPHAWGYDAVMLLPLIFVATVSLRDPPRTPLLIACYLLAPLVDYSLFFGFDVLAIAVIGGSLAWIAMGYRGLTPASTSQTGAS